MAASAALTGMVRIQAQSKLTVTPQRTALKRLVAPTPIIAPVIVCVVETGIPICSVKNKVVAPAVSAHTPSKRCNFGDFSSHCFHNFPATT
jgi:hypothetical protein